MNAPEIVLQGKDTATAGHLYMAFELSDKSWNLALGDGARGPSRYTVAAGDKGAVLDRIAKAKARCGLPQEAKVHSWARQRSGNALTKSTGQCEGNWPIPARVRFGRR